MLPNLRRASCALTLALGPLAIAETSAPTMKAIRFHTFGGAETRVHEDAPRPEAGKGEGGIVVSIVEPPSKAKCDELGIRGVVTRVEPSGNQLAELSELIEAKKLAPVVSEVVPLAEARRAHELSAAGHTRGKLVLEVVE